MVLGGLGVEWKVSYVRTGYRMGSVVMEASGMEWKIWIRIRNGSVYNRIGLFYSGVDRIWKVCGSMRWNVCGMYVERMEKEIVP